MNSKRKLVMTLSKSHRSYFNAAKAMSEFSDYKQKIGCVVVFKHKIVSSGYNHSKTNPLQKKYNKYRFPEDSVHSVHAEVDALLPLLNRRDIDFSHVSIYLYRQYKNCELAPSRCCESCFALIKNLGIRRIFYTTSQGFAHEELVY